jgi:hypothetical protein
MIGIYEFCMSGSYRATSTKNVGIAREVSRVVLMLLFWIRLANTGGCDRQAKSTYSQAMAVRSNRSVSIFNPVILKNLKFQQIFIKSQQYFPYNIKNIQSNYYPTPKKPLKHFGSFKSLIPKPRIYKRRWK